MQTHDFPFLKIEADQFRLGAYQIPKPEGWEPAENFPECCDFHKTTYNETKRFVIDFPNCCAGHKEYAKRFPPKKGEFDYLVEKVVYQVSYTEHHIQEKINNEDWYDDITDYFEYNLSSFGHPGIGDHLYYLDIIHWLKNNTSDIPKDSCLKLAEWFDEKRNPKIVHKSADLNVLHQIHQKWLKTFPFELSYFQKAKDYFSTHKPFVSKIVRTNRYTGLTAFQVHTEESMIEYLFDLTKTLLAYIKSDELVKQGKISDFNKSNFELILQERDIKRKALLESYNKKERKYITTIKQWLKDEIDFFNQLKTLDKKVLPSTSKPKESRKNATSSFKPKYGKEDKIKAIIYELNREFYLLNEEKCTPDDLLNVLLAKQIKYEKDIHFNCYTNQLALIINEFKRRKYFDGLNYASVVNTNFFYSKEGTKLNGNIFSSSWNQNPNPDREEEIVAVFDRFQKKH